MSRAPVTVAILSRSGWADLKACLESLRPTLGLRDEVVLAVDPADAKTTNAGLRLYPWVHAIEVAVDQPADARKAMASRARHDIIVFLDSTTVLAHSWIDPLVEALADGSVGMAGPRFNFAPGPQMISDAFYVTNSDMRRFARRWAAEHKGEVTDAARLAPMCVAVSKHSLAAYVGLGSAAGNDVDEFDRLAKHLSDAGSRVVICHGAFVHCEPHGSDFRVPRGAGLQTSQSAGRMLVSACLIVKDEESNISDCLNSLGNVADEVIVYDTGSQDDTVRLAEESGATVIAGFWDDDFSRARNAALEQCHGEWVVWLDADETLQVNDPDALRSMLVRTRPTIDAWSVRIQNLTGTGAGSEFTHHAARIFRRSRCEWTGRLHEQIARRGDHSPIMQADLEQGAWIRHTGYLDEVLRGRNKAERNLRVARAEVQAEDGWDKGYSLVSLGRSLVLAGQPEEGLANIAEALDHTDNRITRRLAVRTAVDASIALNRTDDALQWCDRLRQEGADANTADAMEATVRVSRGDWPEVLELLDRVTPGRCDEDGFAPPAGLVAAQKAKALLARQEFGAAADALLACLLEDGVLDTHLGTLVESMTRAGRPLADLASAIPRDRVTLFLAQVLQLQPPLADELLEACLNAGAHQTAVLAAASKLAIRLPVERALVWSFRLRQVGQQASCPLIAIAERSEDPVLKARASAVARQSFGDERAVALFAEAYSSASPEGREVIGEEAAQLCPSMLASVAGGAAALA